VAGTSVLLPSGAALALGRSSRILRAPTPRRRRLSSTRKRGRAWPVCGRPHAETEKSTKRKKIKDKDKDKEIFLLKCQRI